MLSAPNIMELSKAAEMPCVVSGTQTASIFTALSRAEINSQTVTAAFRCGRAWMLAIAFIDFFL